MWSRRYLSHLQSYVGFGGHYCYSSNAIQGIDLGFGLYVRSLKTGVLLDKVYQLMRVGLKHYSILLGVNRNLSLSLDRCLNTASHYLCVIHRQCHIDGLISCTMNWVRMCISHSQSRCLYALSFACSGNLVLQSFLHPTNKRENTGNYKQ